MIKIYTDGGCIPNPGLGAWAFVKILGNELIEQSGLVPNTTNNRMEYTALIKALESLDNNDYAEIYTDSMLLVDTVNTWMHSWYKKNWKKKGSIKNLDLVKQLHFLMSLKKNVTVSWVKGHSGNFYNERADFLCFNQLTKSSTFHPLSN